MVKNPSKILVTIWDTQDGTPNCDEATAIGMVYRGYDPNLAAAVVKAVYHTAGPGLYQRIQQGKN